MKEWCLGFLFAPRETEVVLLKKGKTLHVGKWNGVGGKIEEGETAVQAMRRECIEETGYASPWILVGYLRGQTPEGPWRVFVYTARMLASEALAFPLLTAEWQHFATTDKPHRVPLSELGGFRSLAPHTRPLIFASLDKLRYSDTQPIQLTELSL